ncbi:hypothetical protein [Zunongwangia profunda]|uniref:hypothetical protein n=1 Tax=Zunongwangia profunda TaxID=398743 RepID=UPI001D192678|nr:hypothetical protein [Zunongwangia profunda]MCC4229040.1 hypothetical protein [Zunongwangia profunda]
MQKISLLSVTKVTHKMHSLSYICPIVKTKTYIAVLLTFIFMAKFTAIDADGLNLLFSGSDISFVNPHCKKEKPPKQLKKIADFSQVDLSAPQVIALNGFCTSQFQLGLFSWKTILPNPIAVFNEHFSSRLSYLYLDNASPPPRLC